jgi:hypothetical protein
MAMSPASPPAAGRRWTATLAWAVAGLAVLTLVPAVRLVLLVNTGGLPEAEPTLAGTIAAYAAVLLATVSSAAVGAVLASRRPGHPVGWLLLGIGLAVALSVLVEGYTKYGLLSVLLGLGYAAVVLGLGRLLPQGPSLAVAAATLTVAAVFQPVRRRVQQAVDRRFNRRRYDAARTIEAFSARLRDELDLDSLTGELLAVVDQTIQPTRASLWLRPPGPSRGS